jgi:hypothetical protein
MHVGYILAAMQQDSNLGQIITMSSGTLAKISNNFHIVQHPPTTLETYNIHIGAT